MESIKKSEKKLKEFYIPNMINILISMKNNVQIKEELNLGIFDLNDEKEIIFYSKIFTNKEPLLLDNLIGLFSNFMKIIKSYKATLENIKNEILNIQKLLLTEHENDIRDFFISKNNIINEKNKNFCLKMIELDKKCKIMSNINWELINFKDYFLGLKKLKENIEVIYSEIKKTGFVL